MRILMISLFLLSVPVFACPDLAGTYPTCYSTNGNVDDVRDVVILQSTENDVTTYSMKVTQVSTGRDISQTFVSDGTPITRTDRVSNIGISVTSITTATCDNEDLNFDVILKWGNRSVGRVVTVARIEGNHLLQEIEGTFMGKNFTDIVICE